MKLTQQQQSDIDNLVEQLEKLNTTTHKGGNLINVSAIKQDVDAKIKRIKEIQMINEHWDSVRADLIKEHIEMLRDDIESLGLIISKTSGLFEGFKIGVKDSIKGIVVEYVLVRNGSFEGVYITKSIHMQIRSSYGDCGVESIEKFISHPTIIEALTRLHKLVKEK